MGSLRKEWACGISLGGSVDRFGVVQSLDHWKGKLDILNDLLYCQDCNEG